MANHGRWKATQKINHDNMRQYTRQTAPHYVPTLAPGAPDVECARVDGLVAGMLDGVVLEEVVVAATGDGGVWLVGDGVVCNVPTAEVDNPGETRCGPVSLRCSAVIMLGIVYRHI